MKQLSHNSDWLSRAKSFFIPVLFASLFFSCKTNLVYITVTEPAPVSAPGYIKRVGIVNRSVPETNKNILNKLDQILSAEGPKLDIEGGKEAIRGVKDALMQNSRFDNVIFLDTINLRTTGAGIFPAPLSWDVVENICRTNNVDAVFALEMFDTDSKISYSVAPVNATTPVGSVPALIHNASMVTTVKTGWRIYDPKGRIVLDQYTISESLTFGGSGINPAAAAASLLERKEAVKQTGYKAGQVYAQRILQYNIRVSRQYYINGNQNLRMAKRMSRTGNWSGAGEIWKQETTNSNRKIQGRAYYNMAIINEINGDLDAAIDWAQKSYEQYKIKRGWRYANVLRSRRFDNNRLQQQLDQQSK